MEIFQKARRIFDYHEYVRYVKDQFNNNKATGDENSENRLNATSINLQRMDRLYRKTNISGNLSEKLKAINGKWKWYVIVEGWCGDGAQNLPVLAKIADQTDNIELSIILRDENPEIMDNYLTNGGRAIPKLICFDKESGEKIGTWGPRPENIAKMVRELKSKEPEIPHDEFAKQLHLWYAKDKAQSLINEMKTLIDQWKKEEKSLA